MNRIKKSRYSYPQSQIVLLSYIDINKNNMVFVKNRHIDQWSCMEDSVITPQM